MPSISNYIAEIDFGSGGKATTAILTESSEDAKALLEFLYEPDAVKIDIVGKLSTYSTKVETPNRRQVTAYIQTGSRVEAGRLFRAIYGRDNVGGISKE